MPSYESIVVVEDWISEHYFTSDGKGETFQRKVQELRKGWDADAMAGHTTPLSRFSSSRVALQVAMAGLHELAGDAALTASRDVYRSLREVFGLKDAQGALDTQRLRFERGPSTAEIDGLWLGDTTDALWLDATPAAGDDALTEAHVLGNNEIDGKSRATQPIAKLLSELYQSDPSPKYILVASGRNLYLTDRERWPEGRYLAVDVQLVADRNDTKKGGEIDRLLSIFGRQSVLPDAEGITWWDQRLQESHQHAVGVSQDLRDGIRESIEIIANDVLRRRKEKSLDNAELDGNVLARQSLRFLYRILFLLYAEASPELGVLPKGAGEYDAGYGLDRLRDLVQVELPNHRSQRGTHIYESLELLFALVNGEHSTQQGTDASSAAPGDEDASDEGLKFEPLESDLFLSSATALIGEVGLSNSELQRVLERLLLSKAGSRGERGYISYANLGINQLGAVYEGLMSYTGFIAAEDLREVAKNGDSSKGSWVVPVDRIDSIDPKHFVTRVEEETGLREPVKHPRGSFVFRLAGRERQQSASYYTPEVMTKFVVSQALAELLTEDITADQILQLSICEPALGSGAFAIEAVRQLAEEYLQRKQTELGERIPAEHYPLELQKVKAQIALHQVHGVDLNATAVELAEVSLWLDTMQPGLQAPWFGLRLKRGNSLIGARRATYSQDQVKAKKHLSDEPASHSLRDLIKALEEDRRDASTLGRIHHFLLPGEGWGAAAEVKEVKDLAAAEQKDLKAWSKSIKGSLTAPQIKRLVALAERVERLWAVAARRLEIAQHGSRRFIDYWPHDRAADEGMLRRKAIEAYLNDDDGAYLRLKRVMDAWSALWFWPLTEDEIKPPSLEKWLSALEGLLGEPVPAGRARGRYGLSRGQTDALSAADWNDLDTFEAYDKPLARMRDLHELEEEHPWLKVCERVSEEQGFFHWELEFAPVFVGGGFDLQVGNPPWVRPRSNEDALLAEYDAWWQLTDKPSQALRRQKRSETLALPGAQRGFIDAATTTPVLAEFIGSPTQYAFLSGLQPDLYRSFMARTWSSSSPDGVIALIHPESHFTEKKAHNLRAVTYGRLRRHWQFINELALFEILHLVSYGVHVYGPLRESPSFLMAASLYHPETVERSLLHEGTTEAPGLKTVDGRWDTRPHPERIVIVDAAVLQVWSDIVDAPGTPPLHARMVYPVNRTSMSVLKKLSRAPRVRDLGLQYSAGWHETSGRKAGYFDVGSKVNASIDDVILQGPHFGVATPFVKQPNPSMRNHLDWTELDLEALPDDFIPRTSYQPLEERNTGFRSDYTKWTFQGRVIDARSVYRLAWRRMASVTGVRTLYPTVLPRGTSHVNPVYSSGPFTDARTLLGQVGMLSSIPVDFYVKASGSSEIQFSLFENLARFDLNFPLADEIVNRAAHLVCLTRDYADLWSEAIGREWNAASPTRTLGGRRRIQVELDALAALCLGLTVDELCVIYRTQFPVLQGYDQSDLYDNNDRKVPGEMNKIYRKSGKGGMSEADLRWTHPQSQVEYTYELPFRGYSRENDMSAAYAKFEAMLDEHGEIVEGAE